MCACVRACVCVCVCVCVSEVSCVSECVCVCVCNINVLDRSCLLHCGSVDVRECCDRCSRTLFCVHCVRARTRVRVRTCACAYLWLRLSPSQCQCLSVSVSVSVSVVTDAGGSYFGCSTLKYCNMLCGVVRGALEMINMRVECEYVRCTLWVREYRSRCSLSILVPGLKFCVRVH